MRAVGISPTLKILGNRLCRLFLYLAKGDKVFQAAALTDDVMISPSFPRNAVRGFWPGLGAKSWAVRRHRHHPCRALLVSGRDPSSSLEILRR